MRIASALRVTKRKVRSASRRPRRRRLSPLRSRWNPPKSALIGLGVARAQYAHAIAVLVGKNPEDLDIPHSQGDADAADSPGGVPSTLLERRPDIAAAERTMKAQNAAVGVAVAAYYPTLSLSGSAGFSQSPLQGLLHTANHVWSIGASGTETVFDFGGRHAEVQAAKAAYEAAVASYRNTVLNAFEDVENDLSGLRILADQAKALDTAVHDAIRGAGDRARGIPSRNRGLHHRGRGAGDAIERSADARSVCSRAGLVAAVSLIGDLGGGWSDSRLHDPEVWRQPEQELR